MRLERKTWIYIAVVVVLAIVAYVREYQPISTPVQGLVSQNISEESGNIMVYLVGEVKNPGVIELASGARLYEAVEKAGGLTDRADDTRINLSQRLKDEDKILIPAMKGDGESETTEDEEKLVDINTASLEKLKTLPGVGDVTAQKIIDQREKEAFSSIEDIMKVPGIGKKTFETIRDLIVVSTHGS